MNSVRIRFTRGENVKFISHLDLMKLFERMLRRAGLPIQYSQGFNPHPQMVFGLPLSVGVTSEAEYADFDLSENIDTAEFMKRMNSELPYGVEVTAIAVKTTKGNIMASISGAVYEISVFLEEEFSNKQIEEKLNDFLKLDEIIVKKEGKGGIKDLDIRKMIYKLELSDDLILPPGYEEYKTSFCLKAFLAAGSVSNLKPELLMNAFFEKTGIIAGALRIHRKELFVDNNGIMANPLD